VTDNFGVLQKRFARQLGRDLALLTMTFDPERDTPAALAKYAGQWKADPNVWSFLTGDVTAVRRVCGLFGVDAFVDEGLANHALRTAVIDRRGVLAASIDGTSQGAPPLDISAEPLGWLPVSSAALRAARTAMRADATSTKFAFRAA
jgi:protein SCO1/2